MMKVKNNRRKYGRMPIEYSVEVTDPRKIKNVRTRDISIRGICLITPMPLKENSIIKMKLAIDDEEPILIPIQGKVVWKMKKKEKEYHHGILITSIKGDKKDTFRKFLATKLIEFLLK
ncbi:MAG: PilZ domain-containing protein [Candidatus Kaelpia imicola]|nr:PilZ domain-containing protein [Candidatus Kaelpia imicola]